ncbi:MAG: DNA recombination protein RmuC [Bacteroidota bacterium]
MRVEPFLTYSLLVALSLIAGIGVGFWIARKEDRSSDLKDALSESKIKLSVSESKFENLKNELGSLRDSVDKLHSEKERALVLVSKLETEKSTSERQILEQRKDIQTMQEKFTKDFKILANQIFEEKTDKFSKRSKESIDQLLSPLKERLLLFEKKVDETHKENLKESSGLKAELKTLREMSAKMTEEAENLTNALRNDNKTQGNWGEMILENILESSGLQKDREYFIQQSFTNSDGRRLQPDVVLQLPDDKSIIIDSKVSLKAYEDFTVSDDDEEKRTLLKSHLQSLRVHIKGLSEKKYQESATGKNLDFILMFVPVEPAYLLALQEDRHLFNDAYDRGIVMVSPTTLIASLKIIATTWKHEYQNRNAQEIAERGKLLLEKFNGFAKDFENVGSQIAKASSTYDSAMNKLRDGKGSLVSQAKQLEKLGIKTNKKLTSSLLNDQIE